MSADVPPFDLRPRTTWLQRARWLILLALPPAEALLLAQRMGTGDFVGETAWSPPGAVIGAWKLIRHETWLFLGAAPSLTRLVLAVAVGTLLFGGAGLWDELWLKGTARGDPPRRWGAFLAGHLVALAAFAGLTVPVQGAAAPPPAVAAVWVAAWGAAGVATVALWALACLTARDHLRVLKRCWKGLLLGAAAGVVAWGAGTGAELLWEPLSRATLVTAHALLGLVFREAVCDPAEFAVGTPLFTVRITAECSGYEGVGLVTGFLAAYLWLFRRRFRFPAALLLLPLGAVAIWVLNAVRIAALVAIGTWGWPDVALGGFHSQAGWLAFLGVALGLAALAGSSRWFAADSPAVARGAGPTVAYLAPLSALLLASIIGGAFSAGFDWLYPLRVVAVGVALWLCRRSYAELRGPASWQAVGIGAATFGLWWALVPFDGPPDPGPLAVLRSVPAALAVGWLVFRAVGYVLLVPLAEELAFRGYLIRRLTAADFQSVAPGGFSWLSFVVSSVLFGLLHGRLWLAGTLAGMVFALALRRRGRLLDAVLAHATTNGLLAVAALLSGRWALWS